MSEVIYYWKHLPTGKTGWARFESSLPPSWAPQELAEKIADWNRAPDWKYSLLPLE